jgi:hypothetical protein
MEEHERWALPQLPVGYRSAIDLYSPELSVSHKS